MPYYGYVLSQYIYRLVSTALHKHITVSELQNSIIYPQAHNMSGCLLCLIFYMEYLINLLGGYYAHDNIDMKYTHRIIDIISDHSSAPRNMFMIIVKLSLLFSKCLLH